MITPAIGAPNAEALLHLFFEWACLSSQNMLWEWVLYGSKEIFCLVREALVQKYVSKSSCTGLELGGRPRKCRSLVPPLSRQ